MIIVSRTESGSRIAFMGQVGSQTYLACSDCFVGSELLGFPSFDAIVEAVSKGEAELGMLAVESFSAGRVDPVHHLLAQMDVAIVGEYFHPVRHCLMALQTSDMEKISTIISHPQALMQCRQIINKNDWRTRGHADSASAAQEVAQSNDPTLAVICSLQAGELNGLTLLKENIQDDPISTTVFAIVAQSCRDEFIDPNLPKITTLLITVRNEVASLHKTLGCFATQGINIVRLESYISSRPSDVAQILICVNGSADKPAFAKALASLDQESLGYKKLGTYSSAPERQMNSGEFLTHIELKQKSTLA